MNRIILVLMIFFLLVTNGKLVFTEEPQNKAILEELIKEAVTNNPELRSFEERVEVFKERPPQARSLDDPRFRLSILNLPTDTFSFDQEAMTQKHVSLMQKLPFPGKLKLRENIAEKETEIVQEEYEEKKNNVIKLVKISYQNLLFIIKSIEITEENRNLIREFVKIAETKYAVGTGIQQDVLKAQVELSRMTDQLILLDQKKKTEEARLNTLLNRPTQMPFADLGQIQQSHFSLPFEDLQKIAEDNRPVLYGLRHLIARFKFAARLAEKEYYPDFDVGVSYGQRDDSPVSERADFISAFVTVNIPLWYKTKQSRKVSEEQANIRRVQEQYNSMRSNVFFQIKDLLAEIEKSGEEIELFETGLIPQSRASLESALAGYEVNKVDFLTLVNNEITLYNYEIDYYRAITNFENKLAELEAAVGKRLLKSNIIE